jgi:GTP-binding protein Era
MLKKVSTEARLAMESFLGRKVFLSVQVKVSKDWRDNERQLKRFGYLS